MFYVYILQSEKSGRYYIGSTGDIPTRLAQHNAGAT
ncbi:MAG: GIY-YIG nuclease family protein, partial [Dehalococcoidia bacterium]|nr:GIY-YIG nuclease family protein [Dehalococcoidia bacterium]